MKIILTFLFSLFTLFTANCQFIEPDTFAIYCDGKVSLPPKWFNHYRQFRGETLCAWNYYDNKNIAAKVYRYSDSTYVYRAYAKEKSRIGDCGLSPPVSIAIAEGLLKFNKNVQDTIWEITFDPEDYSENIIPVVKRYLVPTNEWRIFDSGSGRLFQKGSYNKGKRHGEWLQYNYKGEVIKQLIYQDGNLKKEISVKDSNKYPVISNPNTSRIIDF